MIKLECLNIQCMIFMELQSRTYEFYYIFGSELEPQRHLSENVCQVSIPFYKRNLVNRVQFKPQLSDFHWWFTSILTRIG